MPRTQHPLEVYGVQTVLDEGLDVHDLDTKGLLMEILLELRHLNIQLEVITEEEVEKC